MLPTLVRLADDFEVWAPELPGFGKSDKPQHVLNIHELADTLAEWARVTDIERAVFLGNSLGCQVIIDLAVRYPTLVDAAILVGPTVDTTSRTMIQQLWRGLRDLVHEPWSLWRILVRDYLRTGTRRMYLTFRFALQDEVLVKCPDVRAPTLVVRGGYDTVAPAWWIEELARTIPDAQVAVIPKGTHASNYTAANELAQLTKDFLHANQSDLSP
jgi:2-hydroxy-6-oxonona-2,4-dienedioate hydrolase